MQIIVLKSPVIRTETQVSIPLTGFLTRLLDLGSWLGFCFGQCINCTENHAWIDTKEKQELQRPSQLQLSRNFQLRPKLFKSNITGCRWSCIFNNEFVTREIITLNTDICCDGLLTD